jgi:hypothetical protein
LQHVNLLVLLVLLFTMVNPEDRQAKTRSDLGLTRELQVGRTNAPHPACGGARGYAVHET